MTALFLIRISSLTSIIDFVQTRYYQLKNAVHGFLWSKKLVVDVPPLEQDLTSMLDAAEHQNYLRKVLK